MSFLDGLGNERSDLANVAESPSEAAAADVAPAAPQVAPEAPDALEAAAQEASAAAARQAHLGELTPAQVQLAKELAADPSQPIPVKDGRFEYEAALDHLAQGDALQGTRYGACRCACESAVAALLARGPDAMDQGLAELEERAKQGKGPEWARLASDIQDMRDKLLCEKGAPGAGIGVAPNDISKLADDMYAAFATPGERAGLKGLNENEICDMERSLGLAPEADQRADGVAYPTLGYPSNDPDAATKAARDLYDEKKGTLKPGETATLIVSTKGEQTDHAIVIGRKPDGSMFCYDSGVAPPGPCYFAGAEAIAHVASRADHLPGGRVGFEFLRHGAGTAEQ
jgi:hypothetical protein